MGIFPIGNQRVGIVTDGPVLDVNGDPTYTEFGEPITTESVVWLDGCLFEIQTPTEQQNLTVTTSEIGWAFLPIAGLIELGNPAISSGMSLRHNGLDYVMRGDAVLEQNIRGRPDHLFCLCEREGG